MFCRHWAHRVPASPPKQFPLLQHTGGVHANHPARWRPAVRWELHGRVHLMLVHDHMPFFCVCHWPVLRCRASMQRVSLLPHAAPAVAAEWQPMYAPSREQAEADRAAAYAAGVPHGERRFTNADWWAACQSRLRHPFLAHSGSLSQSSCLSSFPRPALWHMIPCTTPASRREGLPRQACYTMERCLHTTHCTSEADPNDKPTIDCATHRVCSGW